jgi:tight adherence protein C
MAVAAGVLAALSALSGLAAMFARRERVVTQRVELTASVSVEGEDAAARFGRLLATLGRVRLPDALLGRQRLEHRLRDGGLEGSIGPDELVGAKLLFAALGVLSSLVAPGAGPLLVLPLGVVGFRLPDLVLARRVSSRRHEMDRELPQMLDLLAAASQAGLAGPLALRRSAEAVKGPLADELRHVLDAVDLGGRWRDELRNAAQRLELPDLSRAVTAMTRTETLGSSLADAMSNLAARVREARRAESTERARKAPVKMLFPLVFLVLPAFLLLTVVPVLFSTVQSIH